MGLNQIPKKDLSEFQIHWKMFEWDKCQNFANFLFCHILDEWKIFLISAEIVQVRYFGEICLWNSLQQNLCRYNSEQLSTQNFCGLQFHRKDWRHRLYLSKIPVGQSSPIISSQEGHSQLADFSIWRFLSYRAWSSTEDLQKAHLGLVENISHRHLHTSFLHIPILYSHIARNKYVVVMWNRIQDIRSIQTKQLK